MTTSPRRLLAALLAVLAVAGCSPAASAPAPAATPTPTGPRQSPLAVDDTALPSAERAADAPSPGPSWAPAPVDLDGLGAVASVDGDRLLLHTASGDVDFLPGIDLGATIPGHAPGEVATRASDYRRWFPMMAAMGFRAVRVYTILPPHFYAELVRYNRASPDAPLYLYQGVWIPEEALLEGQDFFAPEVRDGFADELSDAVAVVSGDAQLPARRGHASGRYTADVTPWLAAWALGVEWDPATVLASDERNAGRPRFAGAYFAAAEGATPTESWLAEAFDHLAGELAARGVAAPITLNNWPSADPLEHPAEPNPAEDLVGVDANHVLPTDGWPAGRFASYHVYPYYPDFQRHEPGIADHVHDGQADSYAGYLTALRDHHAGMPLVITELGVPSSSGNAHFGSLGRDQGDHAEQEQMAIDAGLLRTIRDLGLAGGFLFAWTDEWFKLTWNTMDLEVPAERRPLWLNAWTNEQHFGVLAHEPSAARDLVVDGDGRDWDRTASRVLAAGDGAVREVRARHDEGYLYLRVALDAPRREALVIGVDTLAGGTGDAGGLPGLPGVDRAADYAVTLPAPGGEDESTGQAWVRASNDQHAIRYGVAMDYLDVDPAAVADGSPVWHEQTLMVNRPQVVPTTGEQVPAEEFAVGRLRRGTSDPGDPAFDSRTTWAEADRVVELRLPWALLGLADPSSRQALVVAGDGTLSTADVERLGLTVVLGDEPLRTDGYAWEGWDTVAWNERVKSGADVLAEAVREVTPQPEPR